MSSMFDQSQKNPNVARFVTTHKLWNSLCLSLKMKRTTPDLPPYRLVREIKKKEGYHSKTL